MKRIFAFLFLITGLSARGCAYIPSIEGMKESRTLRNVFLVLALAALLSACQYVPPKQKLYQGEALSEQLVARIDVEMPATIVGFDGYLVPAPRSAVVLPGSHKLVIYRRSPCVSTSGGGGLLSNVYWLGCTVVAEGNKCVIFYVNLEAGHGYKYVESDGEDWLADASNGQKISKAGAIITTSQKRFDDPELCKRGIENELLLPGWKEANKSIVEDVRHSRYYQLLFLHGSDPLPLSQETAPKACSEAKDPEKPWVGSWEARTRAAILIFDIEEEIVRGELKSGSKSYSILGKVNEQGVVDAKIFDRGNEGGPVDVRGTFPQLQLTYPYAQGPIFKTLDGQTISLCS